MVSKKEKGGADIVLAPIVASGLLATATKLYQDMMAEQKKTRRGGNAEVDAFAKQDLDMFSSKSAEIKQDGGKKRKTRGRKPKPKHGGFEEEVMQEQELAMENVQDGGKKRKTRGRKPNHRGGEALLEEVSELLKGGKANKKRTYKTKMGGADDNVSGNALYGVPIPGQAPPAQDVPPVVSAESTPPPMGGGKGKKHGKKRGGNSDLMGLYESQLGGIASQLSMLRG